MPSTAIPDAAPACRGQDPALWDVDHALHTRLTHRCPKCVGAVAICARCPVREACWAEALREGDVHTIRAGRALLPPYPGGVPRPAPACAYCGLPVLGGKGSRCCSTRCAAYERSAHRPAKVARPAAGAGPADAAQSAEVAQPAESARSAGRPPEADPRPATPTGSSDAPGPPEFIAAFAQAAVGMAMCDREGRIVQANGALADLFGYLPAELIGRSVSDLNHPADPDGLGPFVDQVCRGDTTQLRRETACRRRDGSVVWTQVALSPVRDGGGTPRFVLLVAVDVSVYHWQHAQLRHQARHDPLTGLANRRYVDEWLADRIANAGPADRLAACYLDLDRFKHVNDTFGHSVGDEVLGAIGHRLAQWARRRGLHESGLPGLLAARIGGDEFLVLLVRPGDGETLSGLSTSILADLAAPVSVPGGRRLAVSVSAGLLERPVRGTDPVALVRTVDRALYQAKRQGHGGSRVHAVQQQPMLRAAS